MANTTIKIKNNTENPKKWGGQTIQPGQSYVVQSVDIEKLLNDESFFSSINSDELVLLDSDNQVAPTLALSRLKETYALGTLFESENTTPKRENGFTATNVQQAIEELKNNPELFPHGKVFNVQMSYHGTAKNKWLRMNKDVSCDQVPFIVPFNCYLIALTMSNDAYADTDIEVHNMKKDDEETSLQYLLEVRDSRSVVKNIPKNTAGNYFECGDKIGIYVKDRGSDLKKPNINLYFIIKDSCTSHTEQFYNDLER